MEELQLKLTKANENASFLQKSIGEVTLKAEQTQQEAAKKHEEEKKELKEKLLELVRRSEGLLVKCVGHHCVARCLTPSFWFFRKRRWKQATTSFRT